MQQTSSTHSPDWHIAVREHVAPRVSFVVQEPPEQKFAEVQSPSTPHVVLQAVVPQVYGAHVAVIAVEQTPAPLQLAAAVWTPLLASQLAPLHCVADDG